LVRDSLSAAARRLPATVLRAWMQDRLLVDPSPLGSARGRGRHPDHRRHQERRSRSVHTYWSPHLAPAGAAEGQDCISDDFRRLLDEMDGILGEPTIPLLIRLGWLARHRQKDHAAVVRGLCRFVGHVLGMTRNARP
jgi:hypothetical protein